MKTGGETGSSDVPVPVGVDCPELRPTSMLSAPSAVARARAKPPLKARSRTPRRLSTIKATAGEIVVPPFAPLGYLAQSKLILRAQQGDIEALRAVWANNVRLTYSVLNRFRLSPSQAGDAFQDAQFGLRRAVLGFRVHEYFSFSTYAFAAIHAAVSRSRSCHRYGLSVPAAKASDYQEFLDRVVHAPSRALWFDAREAYFRTDANRYFTLLTLHRLAQPRSLRVAARQASVLDGPTTPLLRIERTNAVRRAVDELPAIQRLVMCHRFGLNGSSLATLQDIGLQLGVTRERVRQLETEALQAIRQALHGRGWDSPGLA